MHEFATEALRDPSAPPCFRSPQGAYVAVLTLDSHWDQDKKLLLGHAALGAGGPVSPGCKIGTFGSHSCWSWPRTLGEVVPAFMDCGDVVSQEARETSPPYAPERGAPKLNMRSLF